jgi:ABC-type multidrug transport system fused ATPase/permease subunit
VLIGAASIGGLAEAGVLVVIVLTAVSLTDPSAPTVSLPASDQVLSIEQLLILAAILAVVSLLSHLVIAHLSASVSAEVIERSRSRAIDGFLGASWDRQSLTREGALQETISTLSYQTSQLTAVLATGVAALVNLTAFLVLALTVDVVSTVVVLLCGGAMFAALRPMSQLTHRRSHAFVQANSEFSEEVSRLATLAMELKVFGAQEAAARRLVAMNTATAGLYRATRFVVRFGASLYRDIAVVFLVATIAVVYLVGGDALLGISTVVILIVRAISSAQVVQASNQAVGEALPSVEALYERIERLRSGAPSIGTRTIDQIDGVDLDNVTYSYDGSRPVLHGISLHLDRGEVLGVVGPSGGGKSTLVQILLRLRLPLGGSIKVSGRDYREYDPDCWSRLVSLVPQEPQLMEGTIADNIRFFRPGISDEQVVEAAARAQILAEVERLPEGFDTVLGPRGGGLSGGQRQRVAIARSLVGSPQLLVLDEPTSALDTVSERLFQETLRSLKGRMTMVIVAHRISTLDLCDRLVVIERGRVEAIGPATELRERPGFFQAIGETVVDLKEADPASTEYR